MIIKMGNFWYFFWLLLSAGAIVGLYFGLRNKSMKTKKIVLFSFLAFGLLLHFLKVFIPPYSVDQARWWRDSWFVNICGANIFLFPFIFLLKGKRAKDYMFYIGVLSGLIALFYPQEPLAKSDQLGEMWDIIRFYYHHWMVMAIPLLMVLLKIHTLSYKRILWAPTGLLLLMLFIILNQYFQAELGYIPIRGAGFSDYNLLPQGQSWQAFYETNWKNTSYIYGPGENDAIGAFLALFCPKFFTKVPAGPYKGQVKYWPWFWMIFPAYILVTPLAFGLCMIFDHKNFKTDVKKLFKNIRDYVNGKVITWKLPKKRQPVWCVFKLITKPFFRMKKITNTSEPLPKKCIIVSNHDNKSGPMIYEHNLPIKHATWGAYQMLGSYTSRFKYLRNVLYIQKNGIKKGKATFKALFEALFSKRIYRGMKIIPSFPDMRLRRTLDYSMQCLEAGMAVSVYPEDSSEGYFDEMTHFFSGFVMLSEQYYKKYGEDLPVIPVYLCRRKKEIVVGKAYYVQELYKQGLSRDDVAEKFRLEVNGLYNDYFKENNSKSK